LRGVPLRCCPFFFKRVFPLESPLLRLLQISFWAFLDALCKPPGLNVSPDERRPLPTCVSISLFRRPRFWRGTIPIASRLLFGAVEVALSPREFLSARQLLSFSFSQGSLLQTTRLLLCVRVLFPFFLFFLSVVGLVNYFQCFLSLRSFHRVFPAFCDRFFLSCPWPNFLLSLG